MRVDFAFICDYAEPGMKVSALGIGFDTIYAPEIPYTHPIFFLVVQLRASITEVGHNIVEIRITDAEGTSIMPPLETSVNISQPALGMLDSSGKIVVGFGGVNFQAYGQYAVDVVVQDQTLAHIPVRVAPPPDTE